jgi:hypothetical protein
MFHPCNLSTFATIVSAFTEPYLRIANILIHMISFISSSAFRAFQIASLPFRNPVPDFVRLPLIFVSMVDILIWAISSITSSSEVSVHNEWHAFALPRQARLRIIRIMCITYTIDLALGDFLTESRGLELGDIRRFLAAAPDYTGASFSDIPRL